MLKKRIRFMNKHITSNQKSKRMFSPSRTQNKKMRRVTVLLKIKTTLRKTRRCLKKCQRFLRSKSTTEISLMNWTYHIARKNFWWFKRTSINQSTCAIPDKLLLISITSKVWLKNRLRDNWTSSIFNKSCRLCHGCTITSGTSKMVSQSWSSLSQRILNSSLMEVRQMPNKAQWMDNFQVNTRTKETKSWSRDSSNVLLRSLEISESKEGRTQMSFIFLSNGQKISTSKTRNSSQKLSLLSLKSNQLSTEAQASTNLFKNTTQKRRWVRWSKKQRNRIKTWAQSILKC